MSLSNDGNTFPYQSDNTWAFDEVLKMLLSIPALKKIHVLMIYSADPRVSN